MQGVESTEAEILLELGDTAHEELPAKGRRAIVILRLGLVWKSGTDVAAFFQICIKPCL
jgi:hypothetical protein